MQQFKEPYSGADHLPVFAFEPVDDIKKQNLRCMARPMVTFLLLQRIIAPFLVPNFTARQQSERVEHSAPPDTK